MRPNLAAPWAWCALSAVAIALPLWVGAPGVANAQKKNDHASKRQVSRCVKYAQETTDTGVDIRLTSSCDMPLDCSVSWVLRCEGSKADKHQAKAFPLLTGDVGEVNASSADCGDDGWAIKNVRWSCKAQ